MYVALERVWAFYINRIPNWLRVGSLIAALLLSSVAFSLLLVRDRATLALLLVAAPVGLAVVALAARYFVSALLLLPVTALTLPIIQFSTGTASTVPWSLALSLLLVGIWLVSMANRGWQLAPTAMNRPLLIFMVICIISLPWGLIWRDPILNMRIMGNFMVVQIGSLLTLLVSMAVPLLLAQFITRQWQIKFYLGAFLVCGTLMTATQFFNISQVVLNDRGLWGLWYVAPLFGLLIALPGLRWYWRLLCMALIGWNLYQTMVPNSLWLSGWLPTIVGMLAMVALRSWKAFLIVIVVLALYCSVGPGREYVERITQDNVDEGGLERLSLWEQNWRVVSEHWLFGTGPAGYAPYYMTYFRDDARSTHNNYLDILAQFGFVGMAAWLWFSVVSVWEGWRIVRRAPAGFLRMVAIVATGGWIGALASMMLGDWILPFAYNQGIAGYRYTVYSWIFLGLLLSVNQILNQQEQPPVEAKIVRV